MCKCKIMSSCAVLLIGLFFSLDVKAQDIAVKTNLLSDATATINLGMELGLSRKWTVDVSGNLNAWNMPSNKKWKHWMVQPEVRYWLCHRFIGDFFGFHLHGGQYNVGNLDNGIKFLGTDFTKLSYSRFQGWFVGGGLGYGHSWVINKFWSMEAEIGVGYSYTKYEKYPCAECGDLEGKGEHHYWGITKVALNLIYCF